MYTLRKPVKITITLMLLALVLLGIDSLIAGITTNLVIYPTLGIWCEPECIFTPIWPIDLLCIGMVLFTLFDLSSNANMVKWYIYMILVPVAVWIFLFGLNFIANYSPIALFNEMPVMLCILGFFMAAFSWLWYLLDKNSPTHSIPR